MSKEQKKITQIPNSKKAVITNSNYLALASILILAIFVLKSITKNGFFWDDYDYILQNTQITQFKFSDISSFFSSFYVGNYHPLTTLTWALEFKFFGENPSGYHVVNIFLHLINTVLVFYFAQLLMQDKRVSIFTAVIFAIHPMHIESVAWISERKDVLYSLFYILSMIYYLLYLEKKRNKYLVYTFITFILACLSKSAAITLPLILILIDYYKEKINSKNSIQKIPFLLVSIVFGIVAIISQKSGNALSSDVKLFGLFDRFLLTGYSIYYYLLSFFVPTKLCALHFYPKVGEALPRVYYIANVIVLIIAISVFFIKKYKKELVFGLLFYLVGISLVIQIIPFGKSMVSERYSYVPYIGLAMMISKVLFEIIDRYKNKKDYEKTMYGIFGIIIMLFSYQSLSRISVWKTPYLLFSDVIEKYPNVSFGYWLRAYNRLHESDFHACILDCNKGIALDSNSTVLYANRAVAKYYLADYPGAIYDYSKVLEREPKNAEVLYNRAKVKNEIHDYKGAVLDYELAFKLSRQIVNAESYIELAVAQLLSGDAISALQVIDKSILLNQNSEYAYFTKANCCYTLKKYEEALIYFNKAIEINPNYSNALTNRGITKSILGDSEGACRDFYSAKLLGNAEASKNYANCKIK